MQSVVDAVGWPIIVLAGLTFAGVIGAAIYFAKTLKDMERAMTSPDIREYKFAVAAYPDALILQFGVESKIRMLPSEIKFQSAPWSSLADNLSGRIVDVIYGNRRMAGNAMAEDPMVVPSQKALCVYKGFAVCIDDAVVRDAGLAPGQLSQEDLGVLVHRGKIAVHAGTDQSDALSTLLSNLDLAPPERQRCVLSIDADENILEFVLKRRESKSGEAVIGFAGGLTDRVLAEKLGFSTASQPEILTGYFEINSFVYRAESRDGEEDLFPHLISEVELLWDDTVDAILTRPEMQAAFQAYLNQELLGQLRSKTLKLLNGRKIFGDVDMQRLLSTWLEFPGRGRPVIVASRAA